MEARAKRVKELKELVKKDEVFIDKCKEYDTDPSFVDSVKVSFSPTLDVSAKTINGEIFLNDKLFHDDMSVQARYILHELTHCLQQDNNMVSGKTDKEDYLDDENEQEAFGAQIAYMCEHEDAEEIQNYIENLLDHHNIKGKERREKAKKIIEEM